MRNGLLIGFGAGAASALALFAAAKGSMLGLFAFIFLAPLPIIITGLGWGWAASAVAAVVAAVSVTVLGQPKAAALHFFAIGAPMALFSYFLMLNRDTGLRAPNGDAVLEWYPAGRVLGIAAIIAGCLAAMSILSVASDIDGLEREVRKTLDRFVSNLPTTSGGGSGAEGTKQPSGGGPSRSIKLPTGADLDQFAKLMTHSFAAAVATFWMALACFNLWFGGTIARASGRLLRPWPDLSLISLPRETPLVFIAVIGLSFLSGYPGLIASGFASAFFFAYLVVGLAIIHNVSRGVNGRGLVLFAVYLALFVLNPFSGIIIAMIGIAEPISPIRRKPPGSPPSRPGTPD